MEQTLEGVVRAWDGDGVFSAYDARSESWVFIAIHDTRLGPASGGTRLERYDRPVDGLIDALRLAEGMTYKWAGAEMPYGGGKAVIARSRSLDADERDALLDFYAARLVSLRGAFQTGVDMGTTPEDMSRIGTISGHAVGVSPDRTEDPGPYTALGVFVGIRAALAHRFGSPDVAGRSILVQGVGDVGLPLAEQLSEAGADVRLVDLDDAVASAAAARTGAAVVSADEMWSQDVDVYAPCAVGATLNPDTIPRLRCEIVAGSANNQLLTPRDGGALHDRGILYAPDYVINAGGAIALGRIHLGERDEETLLDHVRRIEGRLSEIFAEAARADESPVVAAHGRAERYLEAHD
ncbi:MAG: hypothetical protein MJB57_03060 [Gemmatimonadetes bacterium]|nr:hypothetical protein [Gemmatimonadota bacterium]